MSACSWIAYCFRLSFQRTIYISSKDSIHLTVCYMIKKPVTCQVIDFVEPSYLVFDILPSDLQLTLYVCPSLFDKCDFGFVQWVSTHSWVLLICSICISKNWAYTCYIVHIACFPFMDSLGLYLSMVCTIFLPSWPFPYVRNYTGTYLPCFVCMS